MGGADDYRIAVAVSNPAQAPQLTRTAADLARERGGEVLVLNVIVKTRESPFSVLTDEVVIEEFGGSRRAILDRVVETASGEVPVRGRLVVATDVSTALVDAVVRFDCDALLVGWHERERRSEVVLGSNVDRVVARAPCDVLVEKIGPADGVESILVPVAEGPHAALAEEVARAIALSNGARIRLLHVVERRGNRADAERILAEAAENLADARFETAVVEGDAVAAVVREASDHDVTVLGSTRGGLFKRRLVGTVPQAVGRRADTTVIVSRRAVGIRPKLERLVREVA